MGDDKEEGFPREAYNQSFPIWGYHPPQNSGGSSGSGIDSTAMVNLGKYY